MHAMRNHNSRNGTDKKFQNGRACMILFTTISCTILILYSRMMKNFPLVVRTFEVKQSRANDTTQSASIVLPQNDTNIINDNHEEVVEASHAYNLNRNNHTYQQSAKLNATFPPSTEANIKNVGDNQNESLETLEVREDDISSPILSYEDLLRLDMNIDVPRDLNIVFMGDSLTRYQYLSLVYFLSYGRWEENEQSPNMLLEKTHESWVNFYNYTYSKLQPYELCDCYRIENEDLRFGFFKKIGFSTENRYFYDPVQNNSVVYLRKMANLPFHASWNASDIFDMHMKPPRLATSEEELNFVMDDRDWTNILKNHLCKLHPKPDLFIFNQGIWKGHYFEDESRQDEIINALKSCGIKSMYKTTTKKGWEHNDFTVKEYEMQLCEKSDLCNYLNWTGYVPGELYWDKNHFIPIVYNWMNVLLLKQLWNETGRSLL